VKFYNEGMRNALKSGVQSEVIRQSAQIATFFGLSMLINKQSLGEVTNMVGRSDVYSFDSWDRSKNRWFVNIVAGTVGLGISYYLYGRGGDN